MKSIGGNLEIEIQIKNRTSKNEIGEAILNWLTVNKLKGWLDFSNGDSKYSNYNTKIKESTHIFISDFKKLDDRVKEENSRAIINNEIYDIMLIDNPMNLNYQLEIYLKYIGGQ